MRKQRKLVSSEETLDETEEGTRSRRQMLRLAGAATAGAAGAVILGADSASAANGGNFILGQQNSATSFTQLNTSGGLGSLSVGFDNVPGSTAIAATGDAGAVDVKLTGTGRLGMSGLGATGDTQPSTDSVNFDLTRSSTGVLWAGVGNTFSSSHSWRRINAVRVDKANGDGTAFVPFRLADTRPGLQVGPVLGPKAFNTVSTFDAGAAASIPDDAIAIFGNLTVVTPTYNGWLTIYPTGVATPTVSTLNFTAGSIVANSFFVGLGTGGNAGKVNVKVDGGPGSSGSANFIIDVTAYVH